VPAAEGQGLGLSYHGPSRCTVQADESAIERIATNLISNAVKFTPRGGSIDVELIEQGETVEVVVRDTGIGIDAEFKRRIFGRFEQGRPAVHAGSRGSGIGLSLVKELCEAHGGKVAVESPRGGGTLFRVTLPRTVAPAIEPQAEQPTDGVPVQTLHAMPNDFGLESTPPQESEVLEAVRTAAATVLVAEDEPGLRRAIGDVLRESYRVILAPDGLTALRLAERHLPDLLVTDVGMPGMDGLELTRRFRALPGNRLAPVVVLTAYTHLADRLAGFEAGAIDYVGKPFDALELTARIRSLLAMRQMALQLHQSEKLASLGTLSAGLAHEMRNPANAIVNAVEPLRGLLPPELVAKDQPAGQLLDVLRGCAEQLGLLSRQLLGFKRQGPLERAEMPFPAVLGRAVNQVHPLQACKFENRADYKGVIYCAGALVTQVLTNLLENAAHAAGPKGWVRLTSRVEGDRLILEVGDSGGGVPRELRERIFEPFFTTKPPGSGTGLGLTMAREIAMRHGGLLDVRDTSDGRVVFHLELPGVPGQGELAQPRAMGAS
jgi:signal transduction histidine kinase